jgi:hypothetical protein
MRLSVKTGDVKRRPQPAADSEVRRRDREPLRSPRRSELRSQIRPRCSVLPLPLSNTSLFFFSSFFSVEHIPAQSCSEKDRHLSSTSRVLGIIQLPIHFLPMSTVKQHIGF